MRFARGFLAAVLCLAAFAAAANAARVGAPPAPSRILYALGSLAPTVAVDTGDLDTSGCDAVFVAIYNGNTTVTRTPTFSFRDAGGGVMNTITAAAITANSVGRYAFGQGAGSTGVTGGYAIPPSPKMRITTDAPASGTGNGTVYVWCR